MNLLVSNERVRARRMLAAGIALALVFPSAASAAATQPDKHKTAGDHAQALQPVVVTAPMQDAPLTVTLDPKAAHQPVPASDGADLLKTVPGFDTIRKGGSNGDPMLRGMAGSRLNILVDGGQIAGGCPSRMDPPTAYIAPELYDKVTIIKGPETVLYGPGNSAGTVLFQREHERYDAPGWSFDGSLLGGTRGRNDQMADFRAGTPLGYLEVDANHTHAGDYEDGSGRRVHSRYERWNVDTTLGWTPDDDTRVELTAGRGNGQAAYAFSGMDGAQFLRKSAALHVVRENLGTHFVKLDARAYTNYADHVMDNFTLRHPDPNSRMPMAMASNVDRRTVGGRVAGTFAWGDDVRLTAGVDGSGNVHSARNGGPPGSMHYYKNLPRVRDARIETAGAFAELHWTLSERQRLITGARLDRARAHGYHLADDAMASGMGGMSSGMGMSGGMSSTSADVAASRSDTLPSGFVSYERDLASAPATFYAGIGHVERFPDYWELFGQHVDTSLSAFLDTRPERTTQLDIGLQYRDARTKAWVSGYYGAIADFILIHYPTGMTAGAVRNVDARIAGGEAGFTHALTKRWKLDATLAYAWGADRTEHRPLPQMPPLDLKLGLTYDTGKWSVGGLWRGVVAQHRVAVGEGNIVGQDLGPTPGFAVFSLNGGVRLSDALTLSAGIDNVFNRTYAEHVNAASVELAGYIDTVRVNEPGRTAWIKLAAHL
ncbi:TonB-dependent copper receptor [Oleiagrimonas soli]|uniref:Iron complex outermembrane receptor protein n=1 Tax=Oleiagrimonas soli TaxID=1543381 RepID=A0A099CSC8_9GAMM|nr:TonB-dependent copper receptor [Oleiagrimonas soli]KGI76908.1 TonB-dependent receptor [Oleiagrimonas soli]MBB6185234.1 iron complex outermembrane receptor protein [Oleiagrimonas soli]